MTNNTLKPVSLADLDTFDGDNDHLRRSVLAFLEAARDDALTPRVPGMALSLLAAATNRLGNADAEMESFRDIEAEAVKAGYPSILEAVEAACPRTMDTIAVLQGALVTISERCPPDAGKYSDCDELDLSPMEMAEYLGAKSDAAIGDIAREALARMRGADTIANTEKD